MLKFWKFGCLIFILLVSGCSTKETLVIVTVTDKPTLPPTEDQTVTPTPKPTMTPVCASWDESLTDETELGWWNERVFYEIFVRSFYDSDGDGMGDFNGIIQKLDYLNDGNPGTNQDLGISGIWLMPINPSPSYHGYDVTDYFAVNPEYGTMEDFKNLLKEAHDRGIKVIIDLVLNHTSVQHPWFIDAAADRDSPYRDYYVWADPAPGFQSPWGTDVWHRTDTGHYYGIFWDGMPDLNFNTTAVTTDIQEVIRFWLEDVGVDGFRLDAIKHLIEDGSSQENTPATHDWWDGFYDYYTGINPDAFTVGEAWTSTTEVVKYIGDEMNIAFEFDTSGAILTSAKSETNRYIQSAHQLILESYPPHQYAIFLTNHDQARVMSELRNKDGQAKTAASLLLTGPGVPFLYYGEEIGQKGYKPDENIRTPMQWTADANAGFTTAPRSWQLPQDNYHERNVNLQIDDPDSLFRHYLDLIMARNQYPALQKGGLLELPTSDRRIYAYLRSIEDQNLLVLINMSKDPIEDYVFCLREGPFTTESASEILGGIDVASPTINGTGGFESYKPIVKLDPYTTYIIVLE